MIKIIMLFSLFLITPAYAQNDLALCKLRTPHVAAADVSYKPGVDVYGNPVVPADLNFVSAAIPDIIHVPMSVDLVQRLAHVPDGMKMKAETGTAEIHKDGRVILNGQELTQKVAAICDEQAPPVTSPQQAEEKTPVEISAQDESERNNGIIWGQGY